MFDICLNKRYLIILFVSFFLSSNLVVADELEEAKHAYGSGQFKKAVKLLRPLVQQENPEGLFLMARMYELGDGVEKDLPEAKRLFRMAADLGHDSAQQKLDVLVTHSNDKSVVVDWYLPAAQQGDPEAQYNLAFMYETGWGVATNAAEAIHWYREASQLEHDVAQLRLAMMTIVGVGVSPSIEDGVKLLRRSAENGNRIAEVLVQDLFDLGEINRKKAVQIVAGVRRIFDEDESEILASLKKNISGLNNKQVDEHVDEEPDEVVRPKSTSMKTDHKEEKHKTPRKLPSSIITKNITPTRKISNSRDEKPASFSSSKPPKNDKKALFKWYLQTANEGDSESQFQLARKFILGDGADVDLEEGLHWMEQAADQNHGMASTYMDLWQDQLSPTSLKATMGIGWLKEAGRHLDLDAIYLLGGLYEYGRGVDKNFTLAAKWYKFAGSLGHNDAKRRLALMKKGGGDLQLEDVSTAQQSSAGQEPSGLMILITIVAVALSLGGFFVYKRRIAAAANDPSSKVFEKQVIKQAKSPQGMEADERQLFNELWADSANKTGSNDKPEPAVEMKKPSTQSAPPPVAAKNEAPPAAKPEAAQAKVASEPEKVEIKQAPPQEIVKSDPPATTDDKSSSMMEAEDKLAQAIQDLVNLGDKDGKEKESLKAPNLKVEKNVVKESAQKEVASLAPKVASKPNLNVNEEQVNAINISAGEISTFGADDFMSNGISRDELAASRVSADSLFADGIAIDEAGKAVGQGNYNPHKLDADSMLLIDDLSMAEPPQEKKASRAQTKRRPVGAAASLLPQKQPTFQVEPVTFNTEDSISSEQTVSPMTNDEERSLAEVHNNIGLMFSSGDGVPKNEAQAVKWFLKAAEEGLPEAQFNVGQSYISGIGVTKNLALGLDWIQKAADNNYKPAREMLQERNKAI